MADDRVADFHGLHAFADFLDPASVFMTHDVWEIDLDLATPNAFDDVQVGSAHASAPDAHNDVRGLANLGIGHVFVFDKFLGRQRLVIGVEDGGLHVSSRCWAQSEASVGSAQLPA